MRALRGHFCAINAGGFRAFKGAMTPWRRILMAMECGSRCRDKTDTRKYGITHTRFEQRNFCSEQKDQSATHQTIVQTSTRLRRAFFSMASFPFCSSICDRLRQLCRELLQAKTDNHVRVIRVEMKALFEALQSEMENNSAQ